MFGPNALDPQYAVPGPSPVAPVGGGQPHHRRRVAFLLFLILSIWMVWQVPGTNADSVGGTGSGGNCVTALTSYSSSINGWAFFDIRFKLVLTDKTVVQFGWSVNNGSVNNAGYVVGPGTFYVGSVNVNGAITNMNATTVGFQHGSTGTAKFFIQKGSPIGTCFKVSDVIVVRTPYQGPVVTPPPGGGGITPPTATPTGHPTPRASAPLPTSSACAIVGGAVPETCDPPPGYCWAYGPPVVPGTWPVVECVASPSPSPSPTPSAPPLLYWSCNFYDGSDPGNVGGSHRGCTDGATFGVSTGGPSVTVPANGYYVIHYIITHGSLDGNAPGRKPRLAVCTGTPNGGPNDGQGCREVGSPTSSVSSSAGSPWNSTTSGYNAGVCWSGTVNCEGWYSSIGHGPQAQEVIVGMECGEPDWYYSTLCQVDIFAYNSSGVIQNPSPTPTASPSSSPGASDGESLPPGWIPPDLQSPGNDPGNEAEGPVNICPPGTAIAACRTPVPNGSGDIGNGYQADPSGLIGLLSEKAPFGYVVQISDAVGSGLASPGSAAPDFCYTADLAWIGVVEFCIPTEPFDYLVEWRWLGVLLVWLAGSIALYRIASAGVGNVE